MGVVHAHCRYAFVIGANAEKAQDTIDALKTHIRFLDVYAADFPEISFPATKLGGIAQRAGGQTCNGRPTLIEWKGDAVVLPTVGPPANWPKSWPLRDDGMVPTSGSVVSASGLTGDGIRGSLRTLSTGEQVRPDFTIVDDPQTHESANSPTQNATRERLISQDVLGMAGPDRRLSAIMPCTCIARGDLVDRVLDRSKHPLWRGERCGILKSMPTNLEAWDQYFEVYARCAQKEPPDFAESNAHYLAHRDELERGAVAAWPGRYLPTEVSAVQHAMHLRFRDPVGFMSEYMNSPEPPDAGEASGGIDAAAVMSKVTNLPRGVVPRTCTRLTAYLDVGAHLLWAVVVAWDESFGGSVTGYHVYPEQHRDYFAKSDPRPGLGDLPPLRGLAPGAVLYAALTAFAQRVLGATHVQEGTGSELRVSQALIDANWGPGTDTVYEFVRRSEFASVLTPAHGKFFGASSNPMSTWQSRPGERAGPGWRLYPGDRGRGRHLLIDSNFWKSFTSERLRTPPGAAGCLSLHAPDASGHRMFADHLAAEFPVPVARPGGGRTVEEWKPRPGRDNDWLDCLVGAAVAASLAGLRWSAAAASGEPPAPKAERRKVRMSDVYFSKHPTERRGDYR